MNPPWFCQDRCADQSFYHWGALTGFIGVIEAGHY
eukprot:SAG22_NODE_872_length_6726_cov_2.255923_7_plen_35_part_00